MLVELRSGLDEDGDDPSARSDIAQLLRMLRMRHDVTYRTRTEIDNVLAEIEAKDGPPGGSPAAKAPPVEAASAPAASAPAAGAPAAAPQARPAAGHAAPAPTAGGSQSSKKLLIIGGAALAAVVAIVLIVVFATSGGNSRKPAAKPSGAASGASNGAVAPAETGSILLGAADVGNVLGDPNMKEGARGDQLRAPQGTLSDQECLSAFEPFQESVYRPHDPTAIHTQVVQSAGDVHRVVEAVAKFPSAEKAHAFVETSAGKWRACANKTVTFTGPSKSTEWNFGEVNGAAPKITMTRAETDNNTRTCQHALSATGDLVIEVQACGNDITDGGARLADQIVAKAAK